MDKPKRALARRMRSNPSMAERILWKRLRDKRFEGLKFRRQMPLGPYVVDFVSLRYRLIIEADGPVHDLRPDNPEREAWLIAQGFRVLHVPTADILSRTEDVLVRIAAALALSPAQT